MANSSCANDVTSPRATTPRALDLWVPPFPSTATNYPGLKTIEEKQKNADDGTKLAHQDDGWTVDILARVITCSKHVATYPARTSVSAML